jgi:UDP-2-acetamido-2-deoxy-ribo-hexuluronate aminotransferase|tara:strand:- start:1974 stop:3023 length:1050 start_codon:yes stop_codon:yes gene_type:complete
MYQVIELFQNQKNWESIKEQVMVYLEEDHSRGKAQNGALTLKLEKRLADHFDRKYCITTASCTDALVIGILALNLKPNSRVAVPNYTFTASAHAVARAGHTVVPVDISNNYCYNPLAESPVVDAILGVDMFGNMCNWPIIQSLGVPTINDAAQSIESHNGIKYSAGYGDVACLSFSPSKTISSWGSGGAILTDNKRIADQARKLRLHGKETNNQSAIHTGLNSMMSSFECACVLAGLNHSKEWQIRRNRISRYLIDQCGFVCATDTRLKQHTHSKLVFQSEERSSVKERLLENRISTAVHYNLMINDEPLYRGGKQLPVSTQLKQTSFTVPNQHTLTDAEVEHIGKHLK